MLRTVVGYAGGTLANPTYRALGDHTEAIQIDYDPAKTSYAELLELFWKGHNPCAKSWSRQYQSLLFHHDEDQRAAAVAARDRIAAERGSAVLTELISMQSTRFWAAEDYHQKYYLRHSQVGDSIRALFDDEASFRDSTLASRANAFAGGHLTADQFREHVGALGYEVDAGGSVVRARR